MPNDIALQEPHTALIRAALQVASPPGAATGLDLACGQGHKTAWLRACCRPGALVLGLDQQQAQLQDARRQLSDANWLVGRAEQLPLPAGSCDLVWCVAALALFGHPAQALAEVVRILRPQGVLVVASAGERWVRPRAWPTALAAVFGNMPPAPPADDLGSDLAIALAAAGLQSVHLAAYLLDPPGLAPTEAALALNDWPQLAPLVGPKLSPADLVTCAAVSPPEAEPRPVLIVARGSMPTTGGGFGGA